MSAKAKKVSSSTKIKNLKKEVKGLSAAVTKLSGDKQTLQGTVRSLTDVIRVAVPFMLEAESDREFENAWKSANDEPGLANWPLKSMALAIDGVGFNATPRFYSVETVRKIRYDDSGKAAGEVAVTSGNMDLVFTLPVFGLQKVVATVTHTEKFLISGKKAVEINNELVFHFLINGKAEQITVRSNGALEELNFLYTRWIDGGSTEIAAWRGANGRWCKTCNIAHGEVTNLSASLTINK